MNALIGLALLLVVIIITQRSWPKETRPLRRETLFGLLRRAGVRVVLLFIGALIVLALFVAIR